MASSSELQLQAFTGQPVRIQIIAREPIFDGKYGTGAMVLDFASYLRQAGCELEFVVLDPTLGRPAPWYVVPAELEAITQLVARDNKRIGRILLWRGSWRDWILGSAWAIYDPFPRWIKCGVRAVIRRLPRRAENARARLLEDRPLSAEELAYAKRQMDRFEPDVVIAKWTYLAEVLEQAPGAALKVIFTHAVLHQRAKLFAQRGVPSSLSEWNWDREVTELRRAQVLLTIQDEEARKLKEMAPECDVICTPMSATVRSSATTQARGRCLFVGVDAPQNVDGLEWFLQDVWPRVRETVPSSSLDVCGRVESSFHGRRFPGVRFLGVVDDLGIEYSKAEVCIIPLRVGSGVKIKLIEALSYGRACVCTSVGIQGLQEAEGSVVLVADTPEDFAQAVHVVLTDKSKRTEMEERARRYVSQHLVPDVTYGPFLDRIRQHVQGDI